MIRDITIGQYYRTDSVIHRLDPRTKLAITFWYIISLFIANNIYAYLFAMLFLSVYILVSNVPLKYILKGLKPIAFIVIFSVVLNLLTTPGEEIYSIWKLSITKQGIEMAVYVAIRLTLLIIGSSIMTYTTTPNQLTDGIEKAFRGLNNLKIPVHEIAMMMCIALRFIPILIEELDKIMKAQMARGARINNGNIFVRLKAMTPIVIPLFISAIRRANDLALAMDARCYRGGARRTKLKPLVYKGGDTCMYLILAAYMAGIIVIVAIF